MASRSAPPGIGRTRMDPPHPGSRRGVPKAASDAA
jgi:hypothetical protein